MLFGVDGIVLRTFTISAPNLAISFGSSEVSITTTIVLDARFNK